MFDWIIQNKEILKLIYGALVTLICFIIVLKSDRLFRISLHQGIRYFRNAFFFYGLAFAVRYLAFALTTFDVINLNELILKFFFEFFLIMGGFFLLYSLIWRKIESRKSYFSSLFHPSVIVFYLMAIILSFADILWKKFYFLFVSQLILFLAMSVISGINYTKKQGGFLKFYFIAMVFGLIAWALNGSVSWMNWSPLALTIIYALNIIIFLLFLLGMFYALRMR